MISKSKLTQILLQKSCHFPGLNAESFETLARFIRDHLVTITDVIDRLGLITLAVGIGIGFHWLPLAGIG